VLPDSQSLADEHGMPLEVAGAAAQPAGLAQNRLVLAAAAVAAIAAFAVLRK